MSLKPVLALLLLALLALAAAVAAAAPLAQHSSAVSRGDLEAAFRPADRERSLSALLEVIQHAELSEPAGREQLFWAAASLQQHFPEQLQAVPSQGAEARCRLLTTELRRLQITAGLREQDQWTERLFQTLFTLRTLCDKPQQAAAAAAAQLEPETQQALRAMIASPQSRFGALYWALRTELLLEQQLDVAAVVSRLAEFFAPEEGLVYETVAARQKKRASAPGSALHTARALELLGRLLQLEPAVAGSRKAVPKSFLEAVPQILKLGGSLGGDVKLGGSQSVWLKPIFPSEFALDSPVSALQAAAELAAGLGLVEKSAGEPLRGLGQQELLLLCKYFVDSRFTLKPVEIFHVLQGLDFCATNDRFVPVVLEVLPSTSGALAVRLTDVLGRPFLDQELSVRLDSAKALSAPGQPNLPQLKGAALTPAAAKKKAASTGRYQLSGSLAEAWKQQAKPGVYQLSFSVSSGASGGPTRPLVPLTGARRTVQQTSQIQPRRFTAFMSYSSNPADDGKSGRKSEEGEIGGTRSPPVQAVHPKPSHASLSNLPLGVQVPGPEAYGEPASILNAYKYLHVEAELDATVAAPQQVFLEFTRVHDLQQATDASGDEKKKGSVFVLQPVAGKPGSWSLRLKLFSAGFLQAIAGPGEYSLSLLVGDASAGQGWSWPVVDCQLWFDQQTLAHTSDVLGDSAIHHQVNVFARRPEIHHEFQAPIRRPNGLVSTVFTGLVAVPGVLLLLHVLNVVRREGLDWPSAGEAVWAVLFQGALGAIILLYFNYWLWMDLMQALPLALLLGVAALITGNKALTLRHYRVNGTKPAAAEEEVN